MSKLRLIVMIIVFTGVKNSFAQSDYYFTTGLTVNGVHRYGREALYSDKLAYQLYTKTIRKPSEGGSLGITNTKGEEIKWQVIKIFICLCNDHRRLEAIELFLCINNLGNTICIGSSCSNQLVIF